MLLGKVQELETEYRKAKEQMLHEMKEKYDSVNEIFNEGHYYKNNSIFSAIKTSLESLNDCIFQLERKNSFLEQGEYSAEYYWQTFDDELELLNRLL